MSRELIELGAIIRKRQTAQAMKRLEPELKNICADYERQIGILSAEVKRLREENAALKSQRAAPAGTTARKGRRK